MDDYFVEDDAGQIPLRNGGELIKFMMLMRDVSFLLILLILSMWEVKFLWLSLLRGEKTHQI